MGTGCALTFQTYSITDTRVDLGGKQCTRDTYNFNIGKVLNLGERTVIYRLKQYMGSIHVYQAMCI